MPDATQIPSPGHEPPVKEEYAAYPKPRTALPLMAPNMMAQVQQTIDAHPEIDSMDEEARGEIIDITDWRVNGGIETPWGRKARNNDPNNPNLNTDGMTYLRPDGLFEIYDCISGIDGNASWEGYGPYAPGENGYWWPPQPTEHQVEPGPTPPDTSDLAERVTALEATVAAQGALIDGLIIQFDAFIAGGLRAHGPVDLPIVLESLTRLRAKGDIDVQVKPGQATPPTAHSDSDRGAPDAVDVGLLKKLLGRGDH